MSRVPRLDPLDRKVWFGDYYGVKFGDLVLKDPEFIEWFLQADFNLTSPEDRQLVEALEMALEEEENDGEN